LAPADHGRIVWFGLQRRRPKLNDLVSMRRRIGLVHRTTRLVSNITLLENLVLGAVYYENTPFRRAALAARPLMERFGLHVHAEKRPDDIPYEMYRRAVYVRELIKSPELMLMEAPYLDLDEDFGLIMNYIMESVEAGRMAFLMTEVPPDVARQYVDWGLIIRRDGQRSVAAEDLNQALFHEEFHQPAQSPEMGG
jgi:ABC-type multidrug transport system ATPase subunit